ncbi:PaaI family thioesterase [Stakelama tenebrarum]|uniref:PaaI family thioesterase n=1 Tax=Stakelama tenebrarum TaxID=2711215 RepID=A0A6G6Y9A3_9SPHN|nr:PaaI family thioesterase [Sphingosinithalassobacter tenebrarum]QIG81490.1 PaaI family thioesterase [Sphingosinithalassobacter tenebrarum]
MSEAQPADFIFEDDPDHPGWKRWEVAHEGLYNGFIGPLLVRRDGDMARIRMIPRPGQGNVRGDVHGGTLLGFLDLSLFATAHALGQGQGGLAATVQLDTQFIAGASMHEPVEAQVELLRETGRFWFLRGLAVQGETIVVSFTALVRKAVR